MEDKKTLLIVDNSALLYENTSKSKPDKGLYYSAKSGRNNVIASYDSIEEVDRATMSMKVKNLGFKGNHQCRECFGRGWRSFLAPGEANDGEVEITLCKCAKKVNND